MPSKMNCPGCQTPLRLRDDMAGKKIKCPRCAHIVAVPAEEVATLEAATEDDAITANAPAAKGTKKSAAAPKEIEEDEEREVKRSKYKPCPRCGEEGAKRVKWTPWGSFYGPALFSHVRCPACAYAYNGKSGRSNLIPAIVFVTIPLLIILGILGALGWFIHHQGYF
jgi:DNA-directed RNA polymerase subunit M/transcription elongation factor TFIIS